MHVLITGGAGFIGSHLARKLLERGDTVAVLDNLSTGSFENIRALTANLFLLRIDDLGNAGPGQAGKRADAIVPGCGRRAVVGEPPQKP